MGALERRAHSQASPLKGLAPFSGLLQVEREFRMAGWISRFGVGVVMGLAGGSMHMAHALEAPLMTEAARPPAVLEYNVVKSSPHDRGAF